MKLITLLVFLASTSLALREIEDVTPVKRQSLDTITDQYLFTLTLPQFTVKHDARDPATLDWTTDDCTLSPDNPLGFPFVPACHRHDFGYNNYKKQNRFTTAGRLRIDNKFKTDLYYQCNSVTLKSLCRALAEVYYAAVRAFGWLDPSRRDEELIREYEEKVAIYNALVEVAQVYGDVPVGTGTI
ncbi:prokaryotic phospholipase A2-domain-containing protein [Microdochium trichocladiopsis]|uniref:Prokaryotic phospholipase A2-domain-containing protein n=1 Tax=Microdochium trichocladiopsis TaxID=1682393 RepID=A0A9P8XXR4_9PEZI|nr:prokaryotic phospholipase A2-domain-containing protein [Microdochium trichocladiopsis]KAH7025214.1 prokaryotic phospholipase A2-domain-containing protein [Microdochium trichocladiopsis]